MENKKEVKKYDPEEAKKTIFSLLRYPDDKDALMKELIRDIIPKCEDSKHEENQVAKKRFDEKSMLLIRIFESESHINLMESFEERYRMLSYNMSKNIIKEFNCTNEIEKALAELTVNAYVRVIDNSRRLNNQLEVRDITHEKNVYIANLSKQVDRANRQFISALMTLKQMKAPQIEMNIKANTAFVSNNQQVNVNKDENIKAQ